MKLIFLQIGAMISALFAVFLYGRKSGIDKSNSEKQVLKDQLETCEVKNEVQNSSIDDLIKHNNSKLDRK